MIVMRLCVSLFICLIWISLGTENLLFSQGNHLSQSKPASSDEPSAAKRITLFRRGLGEDGYLTDQLECYFSESLDTKSFSIHLAESLPWGTGDTPVLFVSDYSNVAVGHRILTSKHEVIVSELVASSSTAGPVVVVNLLPRLKMPHSDSVVISGHHWAQLRTRSDESILLLRESIPSAISGFDFAPRVVRPAEFCRWPGVDGVLTWRVLKPEGNLREGIEFTRTQPTPYQLVGEHREVGDTNKIFVPHFDESAMDDRVTGGVAAKGWAFYNEGTSIHLQFRDFDKRKYPVVNAYQFIGLDDGDIIPVKAGLYRIKRTPTAIQGELITDDKFKGLIPDESSAIVGLNRRIVHLGVERNERVKSRVHRSELCVMDHGYSDLDGRVFVRWHRLLDSERGMHRLDVVSETVLEGSLFDVRSETGIVQMRLKRIVLPDKKNMLSGWVELAEQRTVPPMTP